MNCIYSEFRVVIVFAPGVSSDQRLRELTIGPHYDTTQGNGTVAYC